MRTIALFGALVLLAQIPALAQGTTDCGLPFRPAPCKLSTGNQSLDGTWIVQLAQAGGGVALFEIGTFHADGSYSGANVDSTHTEHKGVWLRVGDRKFVFTIMFFTHDDKGALSRIIKARGTATLAADGASYDSVVERVIMDPAGHELSVTPGIKGHAVRMDAEMQTLPVPE